MKGSVKKDYWFCRGVTENCSLMMADDSGWMCKVLQDLIYKN